SISTMTSFTAPPPKRPAAPYARPIRPEDTAANRSAEARSRPVDAAIGRPSEDTTTASCTPETRSTKLLISQLMLFAAWLTVRTSCSACSSSCSALVLGVVALFDTTTTQAGAVARQHEAHLFGRALGGGHRRGGRHR